MRGTTATAAISVGIVVCLGACTGGESHPERLAHSSEPLLTVGCQTTPISPNGDPGTNAGAVVSGAVFGPSMCFTSAPSYTTPAGSSYPGTFACSNEAVLELDNAVGSDSVNATVEMVSPPTNETDCNNTQIDGILWGYTNGAWVTIPGQPTVSTFDAAWVPTSTTAKCQVGLDGFGTFVASLPIDFSQYSQVRLAGRAVTYVTNSKGVTSEEPLQVTLRLWRYCIT
jgi:hypothetical protein